MNIKNKKVSVVIMTLNAEQFIERTLNKLLSQTRIPDEILIIDSESTDRTCEIAQMYELATIISVNRKQFDHGGSRDFAFSKTSGDLILFFSQDAEIQDQNYISILISNFSDENVAMAYGRQVAKNDARPYEKIIRQFNYPKKKLVKTKQDINRLGIKCFYMSDVCSAYRRDIYYKLGGFEKNILTNEDMLIATNAILSGYSVVYEPAAVVKHSHNYSFMQELRRNFDVGVFLKQHSQYYDNIGLSKEGFNLVKSVIRQLIKDKKIFSILHFIFICNGKFLGNKLGKNFQKLSKNSILFFTANKQYWKRLWNK